MPTAALRWPWNGFDQLALDGVEQLDQTTNGGRGYQSAIRRNRQRFVNVLSRQPSGRLVRERVKSWKQNLMVVAPLDDHDQHPSACGKGCIKDGPN